MQLDDVKLRLVGPDEAGLVLAADVFDHPADPEATLRFLGPPAAADPRNILLLAETGGQVVGFASGTVIDHPDKPRALFINELGVNEEARLRGIGAALIAALRASGRQRGCLVSWVVTETDNAAALALYRSALGTETPGLVMFDWDEGPDAA